MTVPKVKRFWSIHAREIENVEAHETQEPLCWWVPDQGYSLWENKDLFETEEAAFRALTHRIQVKIHKLTSNLREIQARYEHISAKIDSNHSSSCSKCGCPWGS